MSGSGNYIVNESGDYIVNSRDASRCPELYGTYAHSRELKCGFWTPTGNTTEQAYEQPLSLLFYDAGAEMDTLLEQYPQGDYSPCRPSSTCIRLLIYCTQTIDENLLPSNVTPRNALGYWNPANEHYDIHFPRPPAMSASTNPPLYWKSCCDPIDFNAVAPLVVSDWPIETLSRLPTAIELQDLLGGLDNSAIWNPSGPSFQECRPRFADEGCTDAEQFMLYVWVAYENLTTHLRGGGPAIVIGLRRMYALGLGVVRGWACGEDFDCSTGNSACE